MEAPTGTFIFYAAGYNETALDRLSSDNLDAPTNSLYTRELSQLMQGSNTTPINLLATTVRGEVRQLAAGNKPPHKQNPAYYDGLSDIWCFSSCAPIQVSHVTLITASATKSLDDPDLDGALQVQVIPSGEHAGETTIASIKEPSATAEDVVPNAVFLGKKSAIDDCVDPSDKAPFGCVVLKDIGNGEAIRHIDDELSPTTYVNVRRSVPDVIGGSGASRSGARYSCIVDTISPKERVALSSIDGYEYAGDTFYWGTVKGRVKLCRG
jgi:hypothetical protein